MHTKKKQNFACNFFWEKIHSIEKSICGWEKTTKILVNFKTKCLKCIQLINYNV